MVLLQPTTLATMVDYWERLEAALKHSGKSLKDLQLHLDVSYQAMKKVQDGKTKALTAENNAHAAKFLAIDSHWLATGEGTMVPPTQHRLEPHQPSEPATAQETSWHYSVQRDGDRPKWPFATITPTDYDNLSDLKKGIVEGYVKRLVEETNADKSSGEQAAA
jgi:hypothetical protein